MKVYRDSLLKMVHIPGGDWGIPPRYGTKNADLEDGFPFFQAGVVWKNFEDVLILIV